MPVKVPFLAPSAWLQDKWTESTSPQRIRAQLYVFVLIVSIGLIRHYLAPSSSRRSATGLSHSCNGVELDALSGAEDQTIAEVDSIIVYPIKSCAGLKLPAAALTSKGFELDRRWMVVRRSKPKSASLSSSPVKADAEEAKWEKLSLREEPRLTLVRPTIDEQRNLLRLSISKHAPTADGSSDLGTIETPLRPAQEQLSRWRLLSHLEMWGDHADGRIIEACSNSRSSAAAPSSPADAAADRSDPSDWLSRFLGYPVLLIHFDLHSTIHRASFPIYKPPTDIATWPAASRAELTRPRGIEFADEYPLLVGTVESLQAVEDQIRDAVRATLPGGAGGDGRGGRLIGGFDATLWDDTALSNGPGLNIQRFRPNLVLRSLNPDAAYPPFSEDSWERLSIHPLPHADQSRSESESETREAGIAATLVLVARCQRCLLTSVDPLTAARDTSVPLKFLNRSRMRVKHTATPLGSEANVEGRKSERKGPCFGMYAVPLPTEAVGRAGEGHRDGGPAGEEDTYGSVTVGQRVTVRWRPYALDDEERGQLAEQGAAA